MLAESYLWDHDQDLELTSGGKDTGNIQRRLSMAIKKEMTPQKDKLEEISNHEYFQYALEQKLDFLLKKVKAKP